MEKRIVIYLAKTLGLSLLLFSIVGYILKTKDGSIAYLLSLIASSVIVEKCDKIINHEMHHN